MSQFNPTGLRAFVAGEALEAFRRVKFTTSETVVYADANDFWIGTTEAAVASGAPVAVKMRNVAGTRKMVCASSASLGARVYGADDGKVDDVATGGPAIGTLLDAPSAAGIVGEVLLDSESDKGGLLAAAVASSTAVTAATATTFSNASKTINGADLKAGDILRIKAAGICTTFTGSETSTIELLVGTEIVATTGAVDGTSGDVWRLEADVIVRTTGASGTLLSHGTYALGAPGTIQAYPFCNAQVTEDISSTFAVLARVTNSSTGESILCHAFTVELIRQ